MASRIGNLLLKPPEEARIDLAFAALRREQHVMKRPMVQTHTLDQPASFRVTIGVPHQAFTCPNGLARWRYPRAIPD
jgi:hypothetical protein